MSGGPRPSPTAEDTAHAEVVLAHVRGGPPTTYGDAAVAVETGLEEFAVALWRAELFPVAVLPGTGGVTGLPDSALVRSDVTGTSPRTFAALRALLTDRGYQPRTVLLLARPTARLATAVAARRNWPDLTIVAVAPDAPPNATTDAAVIDAIVEDATAAGDLPPDVAAALAVLVRRGYGTTPAS